MLVLKFLFLHNSDTNHYKWVAMQLAFKSGIQNLLLSSAKRGVGGVVVVVVVLVVIVVLEIRSLFRRGKKPHY